MPSQLEMLAEATRLAQTVVADAHAAAKDYARTVRAAREQVRAEITAEVERQVSAVLADTRERLAEEGRAAIDAFAVDLRARLGL